MPPVFSFTQGSDVEGDSILGHRRELPMMTLLDMSSSPPVFLMTSVTMSHAPRCSPVPHGSRETTDQWAHCAGVTCSAASVNTGLTADSSRSG